MAQSPIDLRVCHWTARLGRSGVRNAGRPKPTGAPGQLGWVGEGERKEEHAQGRVEEKEMKMSRRPRNERNAASWAAPVWFVGFGVAPRCH